MDVSFKFNHGDQAEDTLTGFKGIVYGLAIYKNGCKKIAIMPHGVFEGKALRLDWFDEEDVRLISAAEPIEKAPSGGPMPNPPSSS